MQRINEEKQKKIKLKPKKKKKKIFIMGNHQNLIFASSLVPFIIYCYDNVDLAYGAQNLPSLVMYVRCVYVVEEGKEIRQKQAMVLMFIACEITHNAKPKFVK